MSIAGFTSTGSKRPDVMFGSMDSEAPRHMSRASGCHVTATNGAEYLDFIMGLGAVALGYGHETVTDRVIDAVRRGTIGALAPEEEARLADELHRVIPCLEEIRLLKTGAEAVAAAVRIGRAHTGRELVLGCGYHGWLDWCSEGPGVPAATRNQFAKLRFNDVDGARTAIRTAGDRLACVVVEPLIEELPSTDWLRTLREECDRAGAVLVFDEIKTGFRVALGGVTETHGVEPDLMVLGKAIANGYPLAVVGGRHHIMQALMETWVSSTMATEFVSIAAARATIATMVSQGVPAHLGRIGQRLRDGLATLVDEHARLHIRVSGVAQMCYIRYEDDALSQRVAAACAERGLLFKRSAYNFVSLAHDDRAVDSALQTLNEVFATC